MGFFDFLDSRISIAKWASNGFQSMRARYPGFTDEQIAKKLLENRYRSILPGGAEATVLHQLRSQAVDIFTLCEVVVEVELLKDLSLYDRATAKIKGENLVMHTHGVVTTALAKLGHVQTLRH